MDNKQFKTFFKYFLICAVSAILIVFLLWENELPIAFLKKFVGILRPLIIGAALAFVLNKPMGKIQSLFKKIFAKRGVYTKKGKERTYLGVSILTVYILFLLIITAIICFIVPQLSNSVNLFVNSFDSYYSNFMKFVETNFKDFNLVDTLTQYNVMDKIYSWLNTLTDKIPEILSATFTVTGNIIGGVVDIFVGFIFSVYVLAGKNKLKKQVKQLTAAIFPPKAYKKISGFYNLTSNTFSNFINGQLTEAVIIGILCFIGMQIFGFEYAMLISVIIGITNLIPIFGPIIGTIPSALIIMLVDPMSSLWFVIFAIVLQQIESNLIYPRVVGGSVGLAPVWTLAAVLIGGGLFGVLGMVLAVPTMSIIYITVGDLVRTRIQKKEKSDELNSKGE